MNRFAIVCGFVVGLLSNVATSADPPKEQADTVTIPLDQIWAYEMPGTRDVRDLEPSKFGEAVSKLCSAEQVRVSGESLTSELLQSLTFNKPGQRAKPAFAVSGNGLEALRSAHTVMTGGRGPVTSFRIGSDVSIVFFCHESGYYVHLRKVERQPGAIIVRYSLIPHESKEMTRQFALIPVGKFEHGEVKVEIVRAPMDKSLVAAGFKPPDATTESRLVSRSLRFLIEEMQL